MSTYTTLPGVLPLGGRNNGQGGWKLACSYVPGRRHRWPGRPCQDAAGWLSAGRLAVLAVSDGAGSALASEIGSAVSVRTALLAVEDMYTGDSPMTAATVTEMLVHAFERAHEELLSEAETRGLVACDLACTLILAAVGHEFAVAAQVGDGAAVIMDQDGNLTTLSAPTNGAFANETPMLCGSASLAIETSRLEGIRPKAVAAFSDGLQRLALVTPGAAPHEPFFQPLFRLLSGMPEQEAKEFIAEFLTSDRVDARTDDDRTLVVALRL